MESVLSAAHARGANGVVASAPEAQARRNAAGVGSLPAPKGRIIDARMRRKKSTPACTTPKALPPTPPLAGQHITAASQYQLRVWVALLVYRIVETTP